MALFSPNLPTQFREELVLCFTFISLCVLSHTVVSNCSHPLHCSPPGSFVHGIYQAKILEWGAISSSRDSYWPRDWTHISCIAGIFFTCWVTFINTNKSVYFLLDSRYIPDEKMVGINGEQVAVQKPTSF